MLCLLKNTTNQTRNIELCPNPDPSKLFPAEKLVKIPGNGCANKEITKDEYRYVRDKYKGIIIITRAARS
jgi:hypothetical protein